VVAGSLKKKAKCPRVIVLQGIACLSSNESFVAMMKCSPRVTTMGETTGGSSGNPKPHALPNGATAIVPSWEDYLPDGTPLEGHGITPDVAVEWRRDGGDSVMERALEAATRVP